MKNNKYNLINKWIISLTSILVLAFFFQNCNSLFSAPGTNNSSAKTQKNFSSELSGGNGLPYEGAIKYDRRIPGHTCDGKEIPYETLSISKEKAILTTNHGDICGVKSEVDLESIILPSFDSVLGFKGSVFGVTNDKNTQVEAWCQYEMDDKRKLNVLIETNYITGQDKAIIIIESLEQNTGNYSSEIIEEVLVEQDFRSTYDDIPSKTEAYRIRYMKKLDSYPKDVDWTLRYHVHLVIKLYQEKADIDYSYGNRVLMNVPYLDGAYYYNDKTGRCHLSGRLDAEAWKRTTESK